MGRKKATNHKMLDVKAQAVWLSDRGYGMLSVFGAFEVSVGRCTMLRESKYESPFHGVHGEVNERRMGRGSRGWKQKLRHASAVSLSDSGFSFEVPR